VVNEISRWSHYRITVDCDSESSPYWITKRGRVKQVGRQTEKIIKKGKQKEEQRIRKGRRKKDSQTQTGVSDDKTTRLITFCH
jgi:hypothetical protein